MTGKLALDDVSLSCVPKGQSGFRVELAEEKDTTRSRPLLTLGQGALHRWMLLCAFSLVFAIRFALLDVSTLLLFPDSSTVTTMTVMAVGGTENRIPLQSRTLTRALHPRTGQYKSLQFHPTYLVSLTLVCCLESYNGRFRVENSMNRRDAYTQSKA